MTAVFLIECGVTGLGLCNLFSIALQTYGDVAGYRRRLFIEVAQIILGTIGQNGRFLLDAPDGKADFANVLVSFITQSFYIYRIYLISRKLWLVSFILLVGFIFGTDSMQPSNP